MSYNRQSQREGILGFQSLSPSCYTTLCCHWALGMPVWAASPVGKEQSHIPPHPPLQEKKISKAKFGLLAWKNSCSEQTLLSQPLTVGSHSLLLHPHPFSFYYSSSSLDLMWSFQRLCNQTSLSFVRNAVSIRMCILCFLTNGEGVFPSDLCRLIQCIFQLYCIH